MADDTLRKVSCSNTRIFVGNLFRTLKTMFDNTVWSNIPHIRSDNICLRWDNLISVPIVPPSLNLGQSAFDVLWCVHMPGRSSSSSNFISRRIQQNTFHMYNFYKIISQMYSSGGCQRSWGSSSWQPLFQQWYSWREASRVLGRIFYCSQMCRAHYILKMRGSISMGLIFTYSLMIQHGADKYDIMTIAKHAHKLL